MIVTGNLCNLTFSGFVDTVRKVIMIMILKDVSNTMALSSTSKYNAVHFNTTATSITNTELNVCSVNQT